MEMNERIKQLAEEAGFIFWGDEHWKPEDALIDWSMDYDSELKKFAELLVRECLHKINRVGILEDIELESNMIADAVSEHLGVDE
jgi:hypothetical protein